MAYKVAVLSSDEPLLKNDAAEAVIAEARKNYPNALFMIFTPSDFQGSKSPGLQILENELLDPGLFGAERIIRIYLKDLDASAVEVLNLIAEKIRDGITIVVDLPRILSAYKKEPALPFKLETKFKLETRKKHAISFIKGIGGTLDIFYPPEGPALLDFISKRCSRYGFTIARDAASYLAMICEGNLTSIDKSLQMLEMSRSLDDKNNFINLTQIDQFFSHDSRYTGFEYPEALLKGEASRALQILSFLYKSASSSPAESLGSILSSLEGALAAVFAARGQNLAGMDPKERSRFFLGFGIKMPRLQNAVILASAKMPQDLLNFLSLGLSKASRLYANFSYEKSFLKLQEMAVCTGNFQAARLDPED